jgi:opacity protein-like surface antigen
MKSIALAALLLASLAGCAIVPIGPPPIFIGVHAGGGYGGGYYGHGGYRY